jgi:hypothetical protein
VNTHDLVKIIIAIMLGLMGCEQPIAQKTDEQKYCESWDPMPPQCKLTELPKGWASIETAPIMKWINLLLPTGETKVGFQTEAREFLLKDIYVKVYPLAWKTIVPAL